MSDLMTVGLSGVLAAKTLLEVTSENIVNVNTEGYARRSVGLADSVIAGGVSLDALQSRIGGGVSVGTLTRAQNAFLGGTLRNAQSRLAELGALGEALGRLGEYLGNTSTGLAAPANGVFDAFHQLALQPQLSGNQQAAFLALSNFVGSVHQATAYLEGEAAGFAAQGRSALAKVNELTTSLADLNRMLRVAQTGTGAEAGLLDNRDEILRQLSTYLRVTVEERDRGVVEVYVGDTVAGRALVSQAGRLEVGAQQVDGRLAYVLDPYGSPTSLGAIAGGKLGGVGAALQAVGKARDNLDYLIREFTAAVNDIQLGGVTIDGFPGRAVFGYAPFTIEPAITNLGNAKIEVIDTGPLLIPNGARITFEDGGQLRLRDVSGQLIAQGVGELGALGLRVKVTGEALPGDSFTLGLAAQSAGALRLRISSGREIASGLNHLESFASTNGGTSQLTFTAGATDWQTPRAMDALFANSLLSNQLLRPLKAGPVAALPLGLTDLTLRSFDQPDVANLSLTGSQLDELETLTVTLADGGPTATVDLTNLDHRSLSTFAADLTNSPVMQNLGLAARISAGALQIVGPGIDSLESATLARRGRGDINATVVRGQVGEPLRLFTRDGVQVAGPPLSSAAAAALLTEANGFAAGARYVAPDPGVAYRGLNLFELDYAAPLVAHTTAAGQGAVLPLTWATEGAPTITYPGGLADSGRTVEITLTADNGFEIHASPSALDVNDGSPISAGRALVAALDAAGARSFVTGAPIAALTDPLASLPAELDGKAVSVALSYEGRAYTLTVAGAQTTGSLARLSVTLRADDGGDSDLRAALTQDGRLHIEGPRTLGATRLSIEGTNDPDVLDALGLADTTTSSSYLGTPVAELPAGRALDLHIDGSLVRLQTDAQGDISITTVTGEDVAASIEARFVSSDAGYQLVVRLHDPVRFSQACGNEAFGFHVAPGFQATVSADALTLASTMPDAPALQATLRFASSINSEIDLRGTLTEELLLVSLDPRGAGIGAKWAGLAPAPNSSASSYDVTVGAGDGDNLLLTFRDRASGSVIAEREMVATGGTVTVQGHRFSFSPGLIAGDSFAVERGVPRPGDNRNALRLAGLSSATLSRTRAGTFLDLYIEEATRIANDGNINLTAQTAASTTLDAISAQYSQATAVNLDDEAAALLRYQQAYQAAAQIMVTARALFDTIIQIR